MLFRTDRSVLCRVIVGVAVVAASMVSAVDAASAEPPAGVTVSPNRLVLSSPEFRTSLTLRNDTDRAIKLKLSAHAWTQDEDGKSLFGPTSDLVFEPESVTVPPKETVLVKVQVKVLPRGVEMAYRLYVDEDGAAPAVPAPTGGGATPSVTERPGVPVFVHYGRPIGVPYVESLLVNGGEVSIVIRNVGGAHLVVQSIRMRGVGGNGRDVFERAVDSGAVLAQRRLVLHVALEGDQCAQSRQLVVSVQTDQGAPMTIVNMQPGSCPVGKTPAAK